MKESTIRFLGGAGSVTGSNFLLDTGGAKFLVDCGLFQGERALQKDNWTPFPFDPKEITALINTHAHIDHIGRIPKLVKEGFHGPIISTKATKALAEPMLMDAMELNVHDAQSFGLPPLFDEKDIEQAMRQWEGIEYHEPRALPDDITLELYNSGHILGSALAKFSRTENTQTRAVVFSGDLGGGNSPLLPLAEVPVGAQYLLIESVYGDRKRADDSHRKDLLENIIENTIARGGTLLIPAFSTERTQDLLFDIRSLLLEKRIPSVPVYLDSPLAEKITAAYSHYPQYFNDAVRAQVRGGEDIFSFPDLHFVKSTEESRGLQQHGAPKIIIAGSGMSNGGRVLAHERATLPDKKSTVLIVGYQATGSLGRRLVEGAKKVTLHKESVEVHAKIETMYGYSAHMDGEQLLEFVNEMNSAPEKKNTLEEVFVVMGEPASANFLVQRVHDYLSLKASAPRVGEEAKLQL